MASHPHPAAASSAIVALVALSLVATAGSTPVSAAAQPEAEAEPLARIENIIVNGAKRDQPSTNEVKVIHAATVVPALPSLSLFAGDEVITGVNVSVTLIMLESAAEQANRVIIGPASQVSVRGQRSIFLSLGRLLADVRGFFDLLTSRATLAAKGTEFEVRVSEEETRLTVLEGVVDVVQAPPAVARRFEPALPFQFGLVRAAVRSGAPVFAAFGQQAQPPAGGQPAVAPTGPQRARRTITIANRCKQPHLYDVEGPETLPWVHLFSAQRIEVEGGQSRQVAIEIQFDPANVKPGIYKGEGVIKCLDCFNEPGCAQSRDPVAIQVGLGTPQGGTTARAREEVVIGAGGAARPIRAQERACAAVNWTTEVIIAGQPTYSARHVVPQYESPEERGKAFREARDRALCRGDVGGYEALGHVYTDWGEGPKGVEAYAKVATQPARQSDAEFLARMAEAYRLKGQLDDAEAQTRRALAVNREAPSALVALGNVYLDRADIQSDLDQSQQFLRRAEDAYQQAAGSPAAASAAEAQGVARANVGDVHLALGEIAQERQQFDVARREYAAADQSFRAATTVYPRYAFATVGWGDAFRGFGQVAAAQRNDSNARAARASAELQYRASLKNHPDQPDALIGLGDVYADQGRSKEAVETYVRAVRARPTEPAAYYRLGSALRTENPTLAARYLETHVKLKPAALRNAKTTRQAALMIPTLRGAATIKVPEVRKLDEQAAQRKLSDAGLKGTVAERRSAPGQPPGVVIEQSPAAGAVVGRGASVNLVVSAVPGPGGPGSTPGIVPNVVTRTEAEAMALLTQAGYKVRVERRRSDRPAGTVTKQRPEAGDKAKPGAEIRLEVAEAEAARPVSVPDIVGDDRRRAVEKIQERRLVVGGVTEQASCETAGEVISQTPREDQRVPAGTSVSFVVAGPGDRPARVPRLIGLRQDDAEDAIRESRLRVGGRVNRRETDQQAPGTVLEQRPDANTVLAPGCPVEMTVAVPTPLVDVPNFIGMTEADAKRRLPGGAGGVFAELRLGEVTYQDAVYGIESRVSRPVTTPTVTGQSPSAGARVRRGSAVNLTVLRPRQGGGGSQDAPPIQVPNVTGMTLAAAQRRLSAAGLGTGSIEYVRSSAASEEKVLRQQPAAGSTVARGSRVNLWVSPRDTRRPVPRVEGMEESRARAVIEQAGFRVGGVIYKQSKSRAGTVIQQWPNAGTPWEPGTRINLTVSGYIVK